MNKVMTRMRGGGAGERPGAAGRRRPPGRRDARRPGGGAGAGTVTRRPSARTAPAPAPVPASAPAPAPVPVRPTDVFAERLVGVLSGQSPVHSMLRHTVGRAYDDLALLAERGVLRTRGGVRPVVRDIGYYVARAGALEVFVRVGAGDRVRALAFRLEQGDDRRWRCVAVEAGP
ncbi:Rv3235 family protein [Streptomyces sp. NPDC002640]